MSKLIIEIEELIKGERNELIGTLLDNIPLGALAQIAASMYIEYMEQKNHVAMKWYKKAMIVGQKFDNFQEEVDKLW